MNPVPSIPGEPIPGETMEERSTPPVRINDVETDPSLSWESMPEGEGPVPWFTNIFRFALAGVSLFLFFFPCNVLWFFGVSRDFLVSSIVWVWGCVLLRILGIRVEYEGPGTIPEKGPFMFVSNHQSVLEVPIFVSNFHIPCFYTTKKEFGYVPFMGWLMKQTNQVLIDRGNRMRAKKSLDNAVKQLKEGRITMMMPEGTRHGHGQLGPYKKGVFHMAIEAGVPLVPMVFLNTGERWPTKSFRLRPGIARVWVGHPIDTSSWTKDTIEDHMLEVRKVIAQVLAMYRESRGYPAPLPSEWQEEERPCVK